MPVPAEMASVTIRYAAVLPRPTVGATGCARSPFVAPRWPRPQLSQRDVLPCACPAHPICTGILLNPSSTFCCPARSLLLTADPCTKTCLRRQPSPSQPAVAFLVSFSSLRFDPSVREHGSCSGLAQFQSLFSLDATAIYSSPKLIFLLEAGSSRLAWIASHIASARVRPLAGIHSFSAFVLFLVTSLTSYEIVTLLYFCILFACVRADRTACLTVRLPFGGVSAALRPISPASETDRCRSSIALLQISAHGD